jgi:hypothetical protein
VIGLGETAAEELGRSHCLGELAVEIAVVTSKVSAITMKPPINHQL